MFRCKFSFKRVEYAIPPRDVEEGCLVNKTKTEESISNTTYLIMNWGWNGSYDSGRYSTTGDWKVDDYNFRYEKAMISNFKKK